jgi:hypothetical protein
MPLPVKYASLQSESQILNRVQDNLQRAMDPITSVKISNGMMLTGIKLTTTPTQVPHRLSRRFQGYWVVGSSANATIWQPDFSAPVNPTKVINLTASVAVTVNLWVF